MNFLNARFGDNGKVWHLLSAVAIGAATWVVIIGGLFRLF